MQLSEDSAILDATLHDAGDVSLQAADFVVADLQLLLQLLHFLAVIVGINPVADVNYMSLLCNYTIVERALCNCSMSC